MDKYQIRKEFIKLRNKGHSYSQCRRILVAKYSYPVTVRTLMRWIKKFDNNWDLEDKSRKPKTIYYKITPMIEEKIISIRNPAF